MSIFNKVLALSLVMLTKKLEIELFFIFEDVAFLKLLMNKFGLLILFGPGNPDKDKLVVEQIMLFRLYLLFKPWASISPYVLSFYYKRKKN